MSFRASFFQFCFPVVVFSGFLLFFLFCPTVRLSSVLGRGQTYFSPDPHAASLAASELSPIDNVYLLKAAASAVMQHFQLGYIFGCLLVDFDSSFPRISKIFYRNYCVQLFDSMSF